MSKANQSVRYCLVFTMVVVAFACVIEYASPLTPSTHTPSTSTELASRYQLRNRTPNFFSRSKTSNTPPARTTPPQPVVRRG